MKKLMLLIILPIALVLPASAEIKYNSYTDLCYSSISTNYDTKEYNHHILQICLAGARAQILSGGKVKRSTLRKNAENYLKAIGTKTALILLKDLKKTKSFESIFKIK